MQAARKCIPKHPLWKKLVVEALATYVALLVHFVAAATADGTTTVGRLAIALTQGLVIYHISAIFWRSGPHANFWISALAFFNKATPRMDLIALVLYWLLQFGFAVLAGLTARAILPSGSALGLPTITTSTGAAILVESLLSFLSSITMLTLSINYSKRFFEKLNYNNPALVAGLTHLILVYIGLCAGTGGCVNSLRHFGVAVFAGFASNSYIYYVSHLIGTLVATIVYMVVLKETVVSTRGASM